MDIFEELDRLQVIDGNIRAQYDDLDEADKKRAEDNVENAVNEIEDWE